MGSCLLVDGLSVLGGLGVFDVDALSTFLVFAQTSKLAALGNMVWVGLQVALGLGFVIFVHELGHFLAAKTFGVRCDKFYVGFDVPISIGPIKLPSTLGKFQYGETEYGIGIIPLGGYVKMLGQDDDPRQAEAEAARIRAEGGEDAPLDPRSYPAKPVWQRMIIISAGVVMNLIFAVILAGIAYEFGVPYTPTVAGTTFGGGPAWQADLKPGDQILRIGEMKEDSPQLRYNDFAQSVAMFGFENQDGPLPMSVMRGSERKELVANPTAKYHPKGFYLIGVNAPLTPEFGPDPYREGSYLGQNGAPEIKAKDKVIAVNGEKLPVDERFGEILGSVFTAELQANWEEPVTITVERKTSDDSEAKEEIDFELPAVPVCGLGLGFAAGPVTAVNANSLGEQAGLQVGDVIEAVNGNAVVNALELPSIFGRLAGQDVTLTVARGEGASQESVELTLVSPAKPSFDAIAPRAGEVTLGGTGVAFGVLPKITSVDDADSGLQVGDELMQVQWTPREEDREKLKKYFNPKQAFEPIAIDQHFTIASLYSLLQSIPDDSELRCIVTRDGTVQDAVTLTNTYQEDWFWHQRGVLLTPLMEIHQTTSLADAAILGFGETTRRFKEVLNVLKLLFTGQLGLNGLGGPGQIAYVAASEANMGVSRLMLFLTFLSANLAILNFLPIPALDGGHMVFLTAEAIMGKPVNEALQVRLTMVGVLCLLSLMAFVIIKDILWFAG